jgi:hypothetical protein
MAGKFKQVVVWGIILIIAACTSEQPPIERVTVEPTQENIAPIYTPTASLTPSHTPTITATASVTPSPTITATASATFTPTATFTTTPSQTPAPSATVPLLIPTSVDNSDAPAAIAISGASVSEEVGWACGDFPCEENEEAWLRRIQVPAGFEAELIGNFPGQVNQIVYGADGLLYATMLEDGTRNGSVWRLEADGTATRFIPFLLPSPFGIARQPGTDVLYVSGRTNPDSGGSVWRINSNNTIELVFDNLPCCYLVDNQPNGMTFGADGYLYLGVGALTDRTESANPEAQAFAELTPNEASILRIDPQLGTLETFASGIRNPMDITQDSNGQFYATDNGLVSGIGDRILNIQVGQNYGFPFYRARGCEDCPPSRGNNFAPPDLLSLPLYTLPRGITVYNGNQFPANFQDTLFVAFWNDNGVGQRIVWIDPRDPALLNQTLETPYIPTPFMTGLLRPSDVIVTDDGSLVIADWLYGMIWRVRYTGETSTALPTQAQGGFSIPSPVPPTTTPTLPSAFVTNTPNP